MRKVKTISHWITSHALCYLAYGDAEDVDTQVLDDFLESLKEQVPKGYTFGHVSFTDETEEFRLCEVTDLYSECTKVQAVYFKDPVYTCNGRRFKSAELAVAYANLYFKRTNLILGVEKID
jgi:hypothetical protein